MTIYSCNKCLYSSDRKQEMIRHMNRQSKCTSKSPETAHLIPTMDNVSETPEVFICDLCDKRYNNKYTYKDHYVSCLKKIKELKEKSSVINNTTNNTNNNIINNTNSNNIINNNISVVLNYNETNLDFITNEQYKKFVDDRLLRIPNMVKFIHFDKDRPENHSMYISNLNSPYAHKFEDGKWNTVNQQDFISELIRMYELDVDYWILCKDTQRAYRGIEKTMALYEEARNSDGAEDKIRENVALILYNGQDMVKETSKKLSLALK